MSNANPLLQDHSLPPFSQIKPEHIEPAVDQLLSQARAELGQQLENLGQATWDNLVEPIEQRDDVINKAWSPIGHLNGVQNSDELREAYNSCVVKLSQYSTEMGQHQGLYQAYQNLAVSAEFNQLSQAQQQSIHHALRNFRLAGVALADDKKARFAEIKQALSKLSTQFSNNVMDASQAWYKRLDEVNELQGLPESQIAGAKAQAEAKGVDGYVITLDIPSYLGVMQYAENRKLREELYRAYVSRASQNSFRLDEDQGPWDNSGLIEQTLALRHELALLLGFNHYAELSLATKMAEAPEQVVSFLQQLAEKSRTGAKQDVHELAIFAAAKGLAGELQAWDLAFYSEQLKTEKYAVSQEQLRPYFPAAKVCQGLFAVAKKLFGIDIEQQEADVWHPDVGFYQVSRNGQAAAYFYLDLYAREHKRGGAWMDECRVRRSTEQGLQLPVAYLTCNFTPPLGDKPSLLNHNEVTTLFHEFGHGLHHMLTQVEVAAVSGINGVAWDAVELPSQFLENWCWHKDVIPMISEHFETAEALPDDLLDKLLAAKNFQSAMQMLRQVEFALFDFSLHLNYQVDEPLPVQAVLDQVRQEVAVMVPPSFNQFQDSFSHIFAGGYAAGYYSYKWAEVLSADAFSRFEQEGIFAPAAGQDFLHSILEQGGSREAMALFTEFRGREPNTDALLRHSGIGGSN